LKEAALHVDDGHSTQSQQTLHMRASGMDLPV